MTFAAFPTVFPLAGNTEESALSKMPPTEVELPFDADVAFATAPNAVYVCPSTPPSASPIAPNIPPSCATGSPDGSYAAC